MKKAIVIGASSGIGRALAKELAENGYELGLAGRRIELMEELAGEVSVRCFVRRLDLARPEEARRSLEHLLDEMGDVELIVINSGVGYSEPSWPEEVEILEVNVSGFTAMARLAMDYFRDRGSGHLVGISSISALRGISSAYSASKAFNSTYLEGLRLEADKRGLNVAVTDVKPGYVATPMTAGKTDMFWVASAEKAARQIYGAIRRRRRHVYVTRRWRLMGWFLKSLPYPLMARLARAGEDKQR